MEKRIVITRHVDCEGPGYLLEVLNHNRIPYEILKIDQGVSVPETLDGILAIVSMGGGMSVNDDLPWIEKEISLMQMAFRAELPVLGHCLGAQLMAKALGGTVFANPVKEIGWMDVSIQKNGVTDYWLKDLPLTFPVFHWHGETFTLPKNAINILSSDHCAHQAFVLGNSIGFQCHLEMTEDMVREWAQKFADQIDTNQPTQQSPAQMLEQLNEKTENLQRVANVIYSRWLALFVDIATAA